MTGFRADEAQGGSDGPTRKTSSRRRESPRDPDDDCGHLASTLTGCLSAPTAVIFSPVPAWGMYRAMTLT